MPLTIDHIHPKSRGSCDRVSNLILACASCNQRKNAQDVWEFLAHDPERLTRIEMRRKALLKDAAAVNSTRRVFSEQLKATGLIVEVGSSGRTNYNRSRQHYPKAHSIDAARVGESGKQVRPPPLLRPLQVAAAGRGRRQMQNVTKQRVPGDKAKSRQKVYFDLQTSDTVRAIVPQGRFQGMHVGRAACTKSRSFKLEVNGIELGGVSWRHCTPIHRMDGYAYTH